MLARSRLALKVAPSAFFADLQTKCGIDTYFGVPDSLLKDFCAFVTDSTKPQQHVITANEGAAVAMASGYHMSTGKRACVYLQNSGFGNTLNPLMSLTHPDVYGIPMLMLIGWRGDPEGKADEPQHRAQGALMEAQLKAAAVPYAVMDAASGSSALDAAAAHFAASRAPFAVLIKRDTFEAYALQGKQADIGTATREEAIEEILASIGDRDIVVSTTGMPSREVFEVRTRNGSGHHRDFLTVGSMGHASAIGAGIALSKPDRNVVVIDGDGASIMHLGSLPIHGMLTDGPGGASLLGNLKHIVVNNGAHDSVGGQPTVGGRRLGWLTNVAAASGYKAVREAPVTDKGAIRGAIADMLASSSAPTFLEVAVKKGNRKDLGRPTTTPVQNRDAFMDFLK